MKNTLKNTLLIKLGFFSLSYLSSSIALAMPPQAAFDVCQGKQTGTSCMINTPEGEITGSCQQPPHESQALCIPANHQRGSRGEQHKQRGQRPMTDTPPMGGEMRRHKRNHTITQSNGVESLIPADKAPITASLASSTVQGDERIISANGISKHLTGQFPNAGNPNTINAQQYEFRVPATPEIADNTTPLRMGNFGVAINGVPFDPSADEWYQGKFRSHWQYEALSGAVTLGIDENHAHVQPTGAYHYHGLPTLLMTAKKVQAGSHSPIIGWAADGFPMFALYGYADGEKASAGVIENTSSYRLKTGNRPTGENNPGGHYDGTFLADYEYVAGTGTLDECNGRFVKTADYPKGTYAYFLTKAWPVIPRCHKGTPSHDFQHQRR